MTVANNKFEGDCACQETRCQMESGPLILHCGHCRWCRRETATAVAHYAPIGAGRVARHSHTESKQPWVVIPPGQPAVDRSCDARTIRTEENLDRYRSLKASTAR